MKKGGRGRDRFLMRGSGTQKTSPWGEHEQIEERVKTVGNGFPRNFELFSKCP